MIPSFLSSRWLLLLAGEAVAVGFLLLPDARFHLSSYLALFAAGSLVSLLAARSLSASGPGFLLFCGALFRLTLLARPPDLSDDLWRYLWDGRVAQAGLSPYAYPPEHPALTRIAPELNARLSHRDVRTIYPPAAQAVFRILGGWGGVFALKAFFAAADLTIVLLLWRFGARAVSAAALYAFHPLPITEAAGQGHLDSLGIALLLASLSFLARGRRVSAGVAFAFSLLTKYFSLAATLPILRRGRIPLILPALGCGVFLWLAASRGGVSPAGGIGEYATRWDFNSALYPAAVRFMEVSMLPEKAKETFLVLKERLDHPAWTGAVFPFFYAGFFARALLAFSLAGVLVWIARQRIWRLEVSVFASLAAMLLLSPTLHPWYVLWVLPFAALLKEPAFLFLSYAVPVSYALLFPPAGLPGAGVLLAEYVPFFLLLAGTLWRCRRRGEPPA